MVAERHVSLDPTNERPNLLVIRFSEIFLKGANRPTFLSLLEQNLKRALRGVPGFSVLRGHTRCFVRAVDPDADLSLALDRVRRVFGVASVSLAHEIERDLGAMVRVGTALAVRAAARGARTFSVNARRSDKRFHLSSPEINAVVGESARRATGLKVDLDDAEASIVVEIGPEITFVSDHSVPGPGGLPVGVSGNVLLLLSGGIDSPVAGYLCQKRGCRLTALYFHSAPYTGEPAKQKVMELARELGSRQGGIRLVVVSLTEIQERYRDAANPRLLVLLYRRAMMRLASRVAQEELSLAVATGENLGQVASQTLENLTCIEAVADKPVLRPLLAYDKAEIMSLARQVGTYDISI
ncbi:MAG: tRNA uracil 4-sulfurtransferase ThiI, partial [Candidatus Rokuibacteriota bacterium]